MAITERQIQEAMQTLLLTLNRLEGRTVSINDWDALRGASRDDAPMAIIENADEFESLQRTQTVTNNFVEKLTLVSNYGDDKESADEFRDLRQEVLDGFVDGQRSGGGLAGLDLVRISAQGPIDFIWPDSVDEESLPTTLPDYMIQTLLFYWEEF